MVITCSHCKGEGHNRGGCALRKQGISSEDAKKLVAVSAQQPSRGPAEPTTMISQDVIEEHVGSQLMSQLSSTMVNVMAGQASRTSMLSQEQGPLPDPEFIVANRPSERTARLTTCTKAGEAKVAASTKKKATKNTGAASKNKKARAGPATEAA